jgi:aspartate carbamoyltransferase catalytic subunit
MRTSLSFDVAMKRMGGTVSNIEFPEVFSSELTGGSFGGTVRPSIPLRP